MDPVALTYYALVCGALAFVAPRLRRPFKRLGIGALVGLVAAAMLPLLRGVFSF
jgi:hypothetical protein